MHRVRCEPNSQYSGGNEHTTPQRHVSPPARRAAGTLTLAVQHVQRRPRRAVRGVGLRLLRRSVSGNRLGRGGGLGRPRPLLQAYIASTGHGRWLRHACVSRHAAAARPARRPRRVPSHSTARHARRPAAHAAASGCARTSAEQHLINALIGPPAAQPGTHARVGAHRPANRRAGSGWGRPPSLCAWHDRIRARRPGRAPDQGRHQPPIHHHPLAHAHIRPRDQATAARRTIKPTTSRRRSHPQRVKTDQGPQAARRHASVARRGAGEPARGSACAGGPAARPAILPAPPPGAPASVHVGETISGQQIKSIREQTADPNRRTRRIGLMHDAA